MKNFYILIKRYWTLVLGSLLPITLVISFWVFDTIPKRRIPPPHYDLLYIVNQFPHEGVKFDVINGKLTVWVYLSAKHHPFQMPQLFRFNPKDKSTREIPLPPPPPTVLGTKDNDDLKEELVVDALQHLHLNTNEEAPDGYKAEFYTPTYSSTFVNIFYGKNNQNKFIISKDGNKIYIPIPSSSNNIQFLGWITSDGTL